MEWYKLKSTGLCYTKEEIEKYYVDNIKNGYTSFTEWLEEQYKLNEVTTVIASYVK